MELTKENLYSEIQKYIYDNKFSNLKVFSKQYYHSIVLPSYEDNSKAKPYSIISIDFNDMQTINKNGPKKGDKILYDSIKLMQSALPKESYTIRIGGDEFLFILVGVQKDEALQYETKMHEKLAESSKKIKNTTVTSYCVSSEEAKDLSTLVEIADSGINTIKQTAKATNNLDDWSILQNKAKENFSTFFKTLRFHNFPMETTHLKKILLDVINSYDTFMSEEDNNISKEDDHADALQGKYSFSNVQELNNLFVNNRYSTPNEAQLANFDADTFANVLNYLVRDPLTMQFNKSYFVNHLLEDKKQNFNALRVSSAFVKVCNTLNDSHSYTDKQIKRCGDSIYDFLNEKIDFNQDTFADLPINYMVALNGGDMLLALNPDTDLNAEDIKDFLNTSNSSKYSNDNLLRLVVADKFQNINRHNYERVLAKQSEECNKNKIPLIEQILNDDILTDLLNVTLKDTITFYKTIVDDPKDISAKTKYIDIVSKSILEIYSSLDVIHDDMKPQTGISKFANKVLSIFKKKPIALPEPSKAEDKVEDKVTKSNNVVSFVPKAEIDYSKIRYFKNNDNEKEKDGNSR